MLEKFTGFKSQQENPRLQELQAKGDTITPEEKAELMALTRFPNNPRGQELAQKETLDTITPEEKAELMALTRASRKE